MPDHPLLSEEEMEAAKVSAVSRTPDLLGDVAADYLDCDSFTIIGVSAIGDAYWRVCHRSGQASALGKRYGVPVRLLLPYDEFPDPISKIRANYIAHIYEADGRIDEIAFISERELQTLLPELAQQRLNSVEGRKAAYAWTREPFLLMLSDLLSPVPLQAKVWDQGWNRPVVVGYGADLYDGIKSWVDGRPSVTLTPFHGIANHTIKPHEWAQIAARLHERGYAVVWAGDHELEQRIYDSGSDHTTPVTEVWDAMVRLSLDDVVLDMTVAGYTGTVMSGVATDWAAGACTRHNSFYDIVRHGSYASALDPPPPPSTVHLQTAYVYRDGDGALVDGFVDEFIETITKPEHRRECEVGRSVLVSQVV